MPEEYFFIQGGRRLKGEIEVSGAKNSAVSAITASLLTDKPCLIKNLPHVEDVLVLLKLIEKLGAKVELGQNEVRIQAKNLNFKKLDSNLVPKLRSSILLLPSFLQKLKEFEMPEPGGCLIGARPLDAHFDVIRAFGGKVFYTKGKTFLVKVRELRGGEVILPEFSVTATENALMVASFLPQRTQIKIAALEPQIQDLVSILRKMGAKIRYGPFHQIFIEGKRKLGGFEHTLIPDPIEAGTYFILAGMTKSKFKVKNVKREHLELVIKKLEDFGIGFEIEKDGILVDGTSTLRSPGKIQVMPYPGIPTDLQCNFGVLATQAKGMTLIHDPLYEGRLKYLEEVNQMGGKVIFCDPHRALIFGPTPLFGKKIQSYDIRSGGALLLAALAARGESIISNVYHIDRGYEKIDLKLQALGAKIYRQKVK